MDKGTGLKWDVGFAVGNHEFVLDRLCLRCL